MSSVLSGPLNLLGARMSGSEIIVYMTIISLMIVGIALIMDSRPT
jgi:hypothetical protein